MTSTNLISPIVSRIIAVVCLLVIVASPSFATPPAHYVNNTHPAASDSNPGTEALPWRTIGKCAAVLVAGDICQVQDSVYNERVTVTKGDVAYLGTGAIVRGFTITAAHVTVEGFTISGTTNAPCVTLGGANGAAIRKNRIDHCGVSVFAGGGAAAIAALFGKPSTDVLIDDNAISFVSDYVNPFGSHWVIRNNTLGPSAPASTFHIDGMQNNGVVTDSLFEGNMSVDNVSSDNHLFLNQIAGSTGWIIRYNTTLRSKGGLDWRSAGGHHFYGNTFVGNRAAGNLNNFQILLTGSLGNAARNNIWVNASSFNPYSVGSTSNLDKDFDLWWSAQGSPLEAHAINKDPLFVNATAGNFRLQPGSPAIDAGGPLTRVRSTDTGTGTALRVVDARFFQPGWAGVLPDVIAVGTAGNTAKIVSIDYSSNTITLAAVISRKPGASVWLKSKSDGVNVLNGLAPDIGANEYAQ